MSFPKLVGCLAVALFVVIAIAATFKGSSKQSKIIATTNAAPVELEIAAVQEPKPAPAPAPVPAPVQVVEPVATPVKPVVRSDEKLPVADRIKELFNTKGAKLPFVETITYKSRVDWQQGRPAWLSDYASHYKTSRHFIARSLNGKADYFKQDVANGDRFNVFKEGKDVVFHLLIDTSRCKLWFYVHDRDTNERTLLKTYSVGLGRLDSAEVSGLRTPLGVYTLGNRIAVYKPKVMGIFNNEQVEMIRVFGTRWIPFETVSDDDSETARGLGIHGVPWVDQNGTLVSKEDSIGKYESDGCIRLATNDMEELFAIVITKPTTVELVRDFHEAHLPGVETP